MVNPPAAEVATGAAEVAAGKAEETAGEACGTTAAGDSAAGGPCAGQGEGAVAASEPAHADGGAGGTPAAEGGALGEAGLVNRPAAEVATGKGEETAEEACGTTAAGGSAAGGPCAGQGEGAVAASEPASGSCVTAGDARRAAAHWARSVGCHLPGVWGIYLSGSVVEAPDQQLWPPWSDVDLMLVTDGPGGELPREKFLHRGVLLEASPLPAQRLASPEAVLADYHLAQGLRRNTLLCDPDGRLAPLQRAVEAQFARRRWVRARMAQAMEKSQRGLSGLDPASPFWAQVNGWAFSTGVMTHVLLVAALRNPTVRRRYHAVRELLLAAGRAPLHEALLEALGSAYWTAAQARGHLEALLETVDACGALMRTPLPWSADLTASSRPILSQGLRADIEAGGHREAAFWIVATAARCQGVLAADGSPADRARHGGPWRWLLEDLGIPDERALLQRAALGRALLPRVLAAGEELLAENPAVWERED
ncbi:MAG: hypothetical protein GXY79_03440 [Chloroflexi bacterium]|nr:hypothetical protein [Chloroflexota bacterium]